VPGSPQLRSRRAQWTVTVRSRNVFSLIKAFVNQTPNVRQLRQGLTPCS
jgi:hypothetical protein